MDDLNLASIVFPLAKRAREYTVESQEYKSLTALIKIIEARINARQPVFDSAYTITPEAEKIAKKFTDKLLSDQGITMFTPVKRFKAKKAIKSIIKLWKSKSVSETTPLRSVSSDVGSSMVSSSLVSGSNIGSPSVSDPPGSSRQADVRQLVSSVAFGVPGVGQGTVEAAESNTAPARFVNIYRATKQFFASKMFYIGLIFLAVILIIALIFGILIVTRNLNVNRSKKLSSPGFNLNYATQLRPSSQIETNFFNFDIFKQVTGVQIEWQKLDQTLTDVFITDQPRYNQIFLSQESQLNLITNQTVSQNDFENYFVSVIQKPDKNLGKTDLELNHDLIVDSTKSLISVKPEVGSITNDIYQAKEVFQFVVNLLTDSVIVFDNQQPITDLAGQVYQIRRYYQVIETTGSVTITKPAEQVILAIGQNTTTDDFEILFFEADDVATDINIFTDVDLGIIYLIRNSDFVTFDV